MTEVVLQQQPPTPVTHVLAHPGGEISGAALAVLATGGEIDLDNLNALTGPNGAAGVFAAADPKSAASVILNNTGSCDGLTVGSVALDRVMATFANSFSNGYYQIANPLLGIYTTASAERARRVD